MATIQTPQSPFSSQILGQHPQAQSASNRAELITCLEACGVCWQACVACADACLAEKNVAELVTCIRLNQDCADACAATGSILSRQFALDWDVAMASAQACLIACQKCGDECARHASHMEHCRLCEQACRQCEEACEALVRQAPGRGIPA